MAVALTDVELAEALNVDQALADRLHGVAVALVERHAPKAPEVRPERGGDPSRPDGFTNSRPAGPGVRPSATRGSSTLPRWWAL